MGHNFSSKYRGVHKARSGKYAAGIKHQGQQRYLGAFWNEIKAAKAYDVAARKLRGAAAVLNFPDKKKGRRDDDDDAEGDDDDDDEDDYDGDGYVVSVV